MIAALRLACLLVVLAGPGCANDVSAQAAVRPPGQATILERIAEARALEPDSARRATLDLVATDLLREIEATERRALGALRSTTSRSADTTVARRYGEARAGLDALLQALEAEGAWGTRRFLTLRAVYPESPMLLEAAARRAGRAGQRDTAIALYGRLLRREPSNVTWQRLRAGHLADAGQREAARRAYAVALDLEPLHEETFRSSVRLATSDDALEKLLAQIRRHRVAAPADRLLGEREVELLQRLGRPDEAAAVAKSLGVRRPT